MNELWRNKDFGKRRYFTVLKQNHSQGWQFWICKLYSQFWYACLKYLTWKSLPYGVCGWFQCPLESWWIDGDTNNEGLKLANSFFWSRLDPTYTYFRDNCNPTCIYFILTDQPNLITSCGVRPSLDLYCKHQITSCNLNFKIPFVTTL